MPLTSYCKKCRRDVPVCDRCPDCGGKLAPSAVRLAWCVEHTPVRDWMCWNAVLRIVLPVLALTLGMVFLLEGILGGLDALTLMLSGALLPTVAGLLLGFLVVLLLIFILQGDDLQDCVIDASGLHVQQYLSHPTAFKLMLHLRSPRLLEQVDETGLLLISTREIPWKAIRRVQLWSEKGLILLYAPRWWQRLAIPCTPFTWEDALTFIRDKIGKRKDVVLPPECVQSAAPKQKKAAVPKRTQQLSIDDIPAQPIPPEEIPPAHWTQDEQPGDFTSLQDVLQEIKEKQP